MELKKYILKNELDFTGNVLQAVAAKAVAFVYII